MKRRLIVPAGVPMDDGCELHVFVSDSGDDGVQRTDPALVMKMTMVVAMDMATEEARAAQASQHATARSRHSPASVLQARLRSTSTAATSCCRSRPLTATPLSPSVGLTYNSLSTASSAAGFGWSGQWSQEVFELDDATVDVLKGPGQVSALHGSRSGHGAVSASRWRSEWADSATRTALGRKPRKTVTNCGTTPTVCCTSSLAQTVFDGR